MPVLPWRWPGPSLLLRDSYPAVMVIGQTPKGKFTKTGSFTLSSGKRVLSPRLLWANSALEPSGGSFILRKGQDYPTCIAWLVEASSLYQSENHQRKMSTCCDILTSWRCRLQRYFNLNVLYIVMKITLSSFTNTYFSRKSRWATCSINAISLDDGFILPYNFGEIAEASWISSRFLRTHMITLFQIN